MESNPVSNKAGVFEENILSDIVTSKDETVNQVTEINLSSKSNHDLVFKSSDVSFADRSSSVISQSSRVRASTVDHAENVRGSTTIIRANKNVNEFEQAEPSADYVRRILAARGLPKSNSTFETNSARTRANTEHMSTKKRQLVKNNLLTPAKNQNVASKRRDSLDLMFEKKQKSSNKTKDSQGESNSRIFGSINVPNFLQPRSPTRNRRGSSVFSVDRSVYSTLMTVPDSDEDEGKLNEEFHSVPAIESGDGSLLFPKADEGPDSAEPTCLICMGKETPKRMFISLPCQMKCNTVPVHKKCIFEWKEQKQGNGTCPLCRSSLIFIDYTAPDLLGFKYMNDFSFKRSFCLAPVPKEAGMVRGYLKVTHNGIMGSPTDYELYVQKPCAAKYPGGPLPDSSYPKDGDLLLMYAKKNHRIVRGTRYFLPCCFSSIDISLNNSASSYNRNSKDYIGLVQPKSLSGLEYSVKVLSSLSNSEDITESINGDGLYSAETTLNTTSSTILVGGSSLGNSSFTSKPAKVHGDDSTKHFDINDEKSTIKVIKKYGSKIFKSRRARTVNGLSETPSENILDDIACITFSQNRIGPDSGPRKMKIAIPAVCRASKPEYDSPNIDEKSEAVNEVDLNDLDDFENENDAEETGCESYSTCKVTDSRFLSNLLKSNHPGSDIGFVGKNKEPYWLDSIDAFSLDFNGRVTLPSNKNFQLEFPTEQNSTGDLKLQFGKVSDERKHTVYTLDFKWPLSPVQAFGICLSSCDRKLFCA